MQKNTLLGIALIVLIIGMQQGWFTGSVYQTSFKMCEDCKSNTYLIGDKNISFGGVSFTCKNDPDPGIRNEPDSYHIRHAPKGNFIQTCSCVQQSASTPGTCAKYSCKVITDEASNPSCWPLSGSFITQDKLYWGRLTEISPFIFAKHTSNAKVEKTVQPDYDINFELNVKVKGGLNLSFNQPSLVLPGSILRIYYDNKILDNLKGGIEIKQINKMFKENSKIDIIYPIFSLGNNYIDFQLDNSMGEKDIVVTPFIYVLEHSPQKDSKKVLNSSVKFVGYEYLISTRAVTEQNITDDYVLAKTYSKIIISDSDEPLVERIVDSQAPPAAVIDTFSYTSGIFTVILLIVISALFYYLVKK
jgi:hypothetical protein